GMSLSRPIIFLQRGQTNPGEGENDSLPCESQIWDETSSSLRLFAAGFNCGNRSQIRRKLIGRESFDFHLNQTHERTAKIRMLTAAAVYDHPDSGHDSAIRPHNSDRFLHPTSPRDHVFRDDEPLIFANLKTASQDQ